jgi:hypothetical protein
MRRPGQDLRRPPEGPAPAGSSGQAGRSRTSSRDDHPWRQLMGRGGVSLVAQDLMKLSYRGCTVTMLSRRPGGTYSISFPFHRLCVQRTPGRRACLEELVRSCGVVSNEKSQIRKL